MLGCEKSGTPSRFRTSASKCVGEGVAVCLCFPLPQGQQRKTRLPASGRCGHEGSPTSESTSWLLNRSF